MEEPLKFTEPQSQEELLRLIKEHRKGHMAILDLFADEKKKVDAQQTDTPDVVVKEFMSTYPNARLYRIRMYRPNGPLRALLMEYIYKPPMQYKESATMEGILEADDATIPPTPPPPSVNGSSLFSKPGAGDSNTYYLLFLDRDQRLTQAIADYKRMEDRLEKAKDEINKLEREKIRIEHALENATEKSQQGLNGIFSTPGALGEVMQHAPALVHSLAGLLNGVAAGQAGGMHPMAREIDAWIKTLSEQDAQHFYSFVQTITQQQAADPNFLSTISNRMSHGFAA